MWEAWSDTSAKRAAWTLDASRRRSKPAGRWMRPSWLKSRQAFGSLPSLPLGRSFPHPPRPDREEPGLLVSPGVNLAETRGPRMSLGAERPDVHVVNRPSPARKREKAPARRRGRRPGDWPPPAKVPESGPRSGSDAALQETQDRRVGGQMPRGSAATHRPRQRPQSRRLPRNLQDKERPPRAAPGA